jgi:hypothetical protein
MERRLYEKTTASVGMVTALNPYLGGKKHHIPGCDQRSYGESKNV